MPMFLRLQFWTLGFLCGKKDEGESKKIPISYWRKMREKEDGDSFP